MKTALLPFAACLLALPVTAFGERADRDKPMQVEADRITIDDAKKTQTLEGRVVLTKGTLVLQSDRVVVTEDAQGFQKGVAHAGPGGLARFRQKREGRDEYVEGEAERIEYNTSNEVAEFFRRASIKSGEDQLRGDYIWYDAVSEKYLATASEKRDPKAAPGRVRAVLQPRNRSQPTEAPEPKGPPLSLKGAPALTDPAAGDPAETAPRRP